MLWGSVVGARRDNASGGRAVPGRLARSAAQPAGSLDPMRVVPGRLRRSGSRRSAARRTRSTPTRSSRRSSADGLVPATDAGRRRPRRRQHVRVHRGRARASRSTTMLALADAASPDARLVVTGCMAERYGDELARRAARGRRRRRLRRRGQRSPQSPGSRSASRAGRRARRRPRPARAAARRAVRAVGVPQDRRGLRPRVRVLRDPVVPRAPALATARRDRRRGARARRGRRAPSSCSSPRTSRGTGATSGSRARSRRCCAVSTPSSRPDGLARAPAAVPLPERGPATRSSRRCSSTPTVVPYFDLSLQHADRALLARMKRWGSGDRFLASDRRHPRRASPTPRSARRSSSGSRARRSRTHDELLAFLATRAARLGRVLPVLARGRHAAADDGRRVARRARRRAAARVRRASRRRSPRPRRDALAAPAPRSTCSSTGSTTTTACAVGRTHREAPEIDGVVRLAVDAGARRRLRRRPMETRRRLEGAHRIGSGCAQGRRSEGIDLVAEPIEVRRVSERGTGRASSPGPRARSPRTRRRRCGGSARPRSGRRRTRHARAAPVRDPGAHVDPRRAQRAIVGHVHRLARALDHRRARRLARAPRRHDALWRVPRPARRQDPRARRVRGPGDPRRLRLGAGRDHRRPRGRRSPCWRSIASRRGISIPARPLGKWKANVQFFAVAARAVPADRRAGTWLHDAVLWVAVAMTIVSAVDLIVHAGRTSHGARSRATRGGVA